MNLQVASSTDDCYRVLVNPYWSRLPETIVAGAFSSFLYQYGGGMRFTNVTIPKGATIISACLIFRCSNSRSGGVANTRISAEKEDNPATFADDAAAFDARWANRTVARVDWDSIPAWVKDTDYNSPEIKTVIQEIVDRAGWVSGNSMVLFWEDFEDRSDKNDCLRIAYSYDGSTTYAPILYVIYKATTVSLLSRSLTANLCSRSLTANLHNRDITVGGL